MYSFNAIAFKEAVNGVDNESDKDVRLLERILKTESVDEISELSMEVFTEFYSNSFYLINELLTADNLFRILSVSLKNAKRVGTKRLL